MREATGELNITLVIVTLVGALVVFFYAVIWPMIDNDQAYQMKCNKAACGGGADDVDENGMIECTDKDGNTIMCKYKG